MDQHAVPQNISSYEFRLVGDMTLKQFLQLAGGAGVGLIIYRLPLPDFIKWPLVIIAAGVGALMAFVPIQGRPFTQWLLAFIKAVYAPTEFFWSPSLLSSPTLGEDARRAGEVLPKIVTSMSSPPPPTPTPKPTTHDSQPAVPLSTAEVASFSPLTMPAPAGVVGPTQTQYAKAVIPPPPDKSSLQPSPKLGEGATLSVAGEVKPTPTSTLPLSSSSTPLGPSPLTPTIHIAHTPSSTGPTTTTNLPPPSLPNILTGLVASSQNQPQEGAILEVVDNATGLPVRALRTNKAGTFQIATPLPNGSYSLYTDKDGLTFNPVSIVTAGQIIQPIIIKAK